MIKGSALLCSDENKYDKSSQNLIPFTAQTLRLITEIIVKVCNNLCPFMLITHKMTSSSIILTDLSFKV